MKGYRKLLLGVGYLVLAGTIGVIIAWRSPHELLVAGPYMACVSTGVLAIVYGNRAEYQQKLAEPAK